jgi:hypothetical protein
MIAWNGGTGAGIPTATLMIAGQSYTKTAPGPIAVGLGYSFEWNVVMGAEGAYTYTIASAGQTVYGQYTVVPVNTLIPAATMTWINNLTVAQAYFYWAHPEAIPSELIQGSGVYGAVLDLLGIIAGAN